MATTTTTVRGTRSGDNRLPVLCKDPAGLALGTDDFVFDFYCADQFAAGAVPALNAKVPDAAFANLALDTQPLIGRAGSAVTLGQEVMGSASRNNWSRGLSLRTGLGSMYRIRKSGVADHDVGSPVSEGFRSFYLSLWLRLRSLPASGVGGIGLLGRANGTTADYGLRIDSNGKLIEQRSNRQMVAAVGLDQLYHLGIAYTFDATAGTSTLRLFVDGSEVGAATAGPANGAWRAAADTPGGLMIGALGGYDYPMADIARVRRVFTAWPGQMPVLDPLTIHKLEDQINRRIFV